MSLCTLHTSSKESSYFIMLACYPTLLDSHQERIYGQENANERFKRCGKKFDVIMMISNLASEYLSLILLKN